MTQQYSPPPPDSPPMDGPDDRELAEHDAALDAEHQATMAQIRFNQNVSRKVEDLRVVEAARARIAAEKATSTNFADQFLSRGQLANLPGPEPLIDRVLPRFCYAILRGRDHSFKSFVAVDWACCLATGKPWQDHHVEPVRVLYIAGEGAHGLAARVDAWEEAWGENVPDGMLTIRQTALNLHQPGPAFDHLLEHVRDGAYGLVIVDTLRRVSGAADGNSSEMGAVIDNLDRIKRATDRGSVLTVAHTDKGDHDTRGYSGIEDDADVVWAAKREDMFLTLQLTKFKDGPDGRNLGLLAQRSGTSLVLAGASGKPETNTTESQAAILEALRFMPEGGVTGPDLMATSELKRSTFHRALKALIADQHVVCTSGPGRTKYYELPALVDQDPDAPDPQPTLDQEAS